MGWFNNQIKKREELDDTALEEACADITAAITGKNHSFSHYNKNEAAKNALSELLNYYHVKSNVVPKEMTGLEEKLEFILHPYGIMRRTVNLTKGWYHNAIGAFLGKTKKDGQLVALIPNTFKGYSYFDPETSKRIHLTKKTETFLEKEAISFYKPFPQKELNISELLKFMLASTSPQTHLMIIICALVIALLGIIIPKISYILFTYVVKSESITQLLSIAFFSISVSISSILIEATKSLLTTRLSTQLDVSVNATMMARIFSLPAGFFKKHSAVNSQIK